MNVVRNGFAVLTKDPQDFEQIAKFRALREASLKSLIGSTTVCLNHSDRRVEFHPCAAR